ncbi:DUF6161 domain-containing protein [Marinobacter nauticus]|uniref:DUF6161 domain-containing protein n=1 Tax=Marinobacter nauticus TaxID=2743 RepID=UPI0040445F43
MNAYFTNYSKRSKKQKGTKPSLAKCRELLDLTNKIIGKDNEMHIFALDTSFHLDSPREALNFIREEKDFWNNFLPSNNDIKNHIIRQLQSLESNTSRLLSDLNTIYESDKSDQKSIEDIESKIKKTIEDNYNNEILISRESTHISTLEKLSEKERHGYLSAIIKAPIRAFNQTPEEARGFILGSINTISGIGLTPEYKNKIDEMAKEMQITREKGEELLESINNTRELSIKYLTEETEKSTQDASKKIYEIQEKLKDIENKSTTKLKATLEQYRSEIEKLKDQFSTETTNLKNYVNNEIATESSVTYWDRKSTTHRNRAMIWGIASIILALVSVTTISVASLYLFSEESINFSNFSLSVTPLSKISVIAFIITIFIWALRTTTQYFNMNTQLSEDCKERVVLVQTYLSLLRKDGALTEQDQSLIMQALFRPTQISLLTPGGGGPDHFWDFMSHYRKAQSRTD